MKEEILKDILKGILLFGTGFSFARLFYLLTYVVPPEYQFTCTFLGGAVALGLGLIILYW